MRSIARIGALLMSSSAVMPTYTRTSLVMVEHNIITNGTLGPQAGNKDWLVEHDWDCHLRTIAKPETWS